jgi:flagellar motor switch protein FliN/FliY
MADDDLLSPEEIESLLNSAGLSQPPGATAPSAPPAQTTSSAPQRSSAATVTPNRPATSFTSSPVEQTLDRAEADLRAAIAPDLAPPAGRGFGQPAPFSFPTLGSAKAASGNDLTLQALEEVELDLRVELGRAELLIEEVLKLREGSVVPLDKLAGDPVDVFVNGRLIARGEVLVLNDSFCVRVAEILTPEG